MPHEAAFIGHRSHIHQPSKPYSLAIEAVFIDRRSYVRLLERFTKWPEWHSYSFVEDILHGQSKYNSDDKKTEQFLIYD